MKVGKYSIGKKVLIIAGAATLVGGGMIAGYVVLGKNNSDLKGDIHDKSVVINSQDFEIKSQGRTIEKHEETISQQAHSIDVLNEYLIYDKMDHSGTSQLKGFVPDAYSAKPLPSSFTIPESLGFQRLSVNAFKNTVLPDSFKLPSTIVQIDDGAFDHSGLPDDFTLPASILTIGDHAFSDSRGLTTTGLPVTFRIPSAVTSIGQFAFQNTIIPSGFTIPTSVTSIGARAFMGATIPTGFTLPSTITTAGRSIFDGAILPEGFALPEGLTETWNHMFSNVVIPKNFTLPSSLTKIGIGTFAGATLPEGFKIPNTVQVLDADSFNSATLPLGFTIPSWVTAGAGSFVGVKLPTNCVWDTADGMPAVGATVIAKP